MTSNQLARLVGATYFVQFFAGSFPLYVRAQLVAPDDVSITVANILKNESLFRLSMMSDVVVSLTWLSIAFVLFLLLGKVQRSSSVLFLTLTAIGAAAINANVAHLSSTFSLLTGDSYAGVFDLDEQRSLGMVLFTMFKHGESGWSLFAGLWLLPLGYAVFRSNMLPRVFGVLLMLASIGYVVWSLSSHLSPAFAEGAKQLIVFSGLVEIAFGFWLLIKGVSIPPSTQEANP